MLHSKLNFLHELTSGNQFFIPHIILSLAYVDLVVHVAILEIEHQHWLIQVLQIHQIVRN